MQVHSRSIGFAIFILLLGAYATADVSYAQKLGWASDDRVLILHVDDAGMSTDSNRGTVRALEQGVANSFSVMMPTPWVPEIVAYIKANPSIDAGLHLTLTSEWKHYRWGPLAGKPAVTGLVDNQGAMWATVAQVVEHASADEVETEIRAQVDRAHTMGFTPTHLDSHMGTLFATPDFLSRYIKVGIELGIPVMYPGGHNFYARQDYGELAAEAAQQTGARIWSQGLPVLDDLHNSSYDWPVVDKVANYVKAIRNLKPGVTMMIMHCTQPSETFDNISNSGPSRLGDLNAMLAAEVHAALQQENIILTTWRELKIRRDKHDSAAAKAGS